MTAQKLIILRGYPASGKSTIGKALEAAGAGVFIDHNSILSFIASITTDDEGIYSEIHMLEQAMARKLLADGKSVIVARGFSEEHQIAPYLDIAKQRGVGSHIIALDVDRQLLESRVISPERRQGFNPSVSVEALNQWIDQNPRQAVDGEHIVDASRPVEAVIAQILSVVG